MRMRSVIGVAVVALAGIAFTSNPSSSNGADVIKGTLCGISLAPIGGPYLITDVTHRVITPSGNATLTCTADIPDPYIPDKAVVLNDGVCNVNGVLATGYHKVFTAGGMAKLVCQVNAQ